MKKKLIIGITIVVLTTIFVSIYLFFSFYWGSSEKESELRTDREPILNRINKLGQFEKVYWKSIILSKTKFGPTPIKLQGYIFLDRMNFNKISSQFQWSEVEQGWKPSLRIPQIESKEIEWMYSKAFVEYALPEGYFGELYLDPTDGMVYFEIEN